MYANIWYSQTWALWEAFKQVNFKHFKLRWLFFCKIIRSLFARICKQTSHRFCSSFIALFVVRWQPYLMPKPDGCGAGNRQIVPIRKLFSNCITQKPIHPLHNQTNTIHLCTDLFVCIFRKKNNGRGEAKGVQVGGGGAFSPVFLDSWRKLKF